MPPLTFGWFTWVVFALIHRHFIVVIYFLGKDDGESQDILRYLNAYIILYIYIYYMGAHICIARLHLLITYIMCARMLLNVEVITKTNETHRKILPWRWGPEVSDKLVSIIPPHH
jgi:hypothetical protein